MAVNIPNRFTNLTQKADADKLNANFDAVATKLNGGIGDAEVDEISESKVVMSPTSGHDHSGGSNGKPIVLAESQITMDPTDGHDHDGTAEGGKLAALATASNQGTVKILSGDEEIIDTGAATVDLTGMGLTSLLSLDVWWNNGTEAVPELRNQYLGGGYDPAVAPGLAAAYKEYYVYDVSATAFTIKNNLGATYTFHWRVIGI